MGEYEITYSFLTCDECEADILKRESGWVEEEYLDYWEGEMPCDGTYYMKGDYVTLCEDCHGELDPLIPLSDGTAIRKSELPHEQEET